MSEYQKVLGKIIRAGVGFGGGGADKNLGCQLTFAGGGLEVTDFIFFDVDGLFCLGETLRDARVMSVDALVGKPVEITRDGTVLMDWRILTEVL